MRFWKYNKKTAANTRNVVDALSAAGNYGAGKDIYSEVYAKIKPCLLYTSELSGGFDFEF